MRALAPFLLALLATASGWAAEGEELSPRKALKLRSLQPVSVEPVGPAIGKALIRKGPLFQSGESWAQILWFKKEGRASRESWFAVLNLTQGNLKQFGPLPGTDPYAFLPVNGKVLVGMNQPGHLLAYDVAEDRFEDLGKPFQRSDSIARLANGPAGQVLLGGGGVTELALYNLKEKAFISLGEAGGMNATHVVALSCDEQYAYTVTRGTGPWELVAVDLATKARRVEITAPAQGQITLAGDVARARNGEGQEWKHYRIKEGHAVPVETTVAPPPRTMPALRPPETSGVLIDESPLYEGQAGVTLHYRPTSAVEWQRATLDVPLAGGVVAYATGLPDGRIAAIGEFGAPAVAFDPKLGESRYAPMPWVGGRCMAAVGTTVFVSGTPNASLVGWDTSAAITSATPLPGRAAVSETRPEANPRLIGTLTPSAHGAFAGVQMAIGADNCLYIAERPQRPGSGFDIVWHNPAAGTHGRIEDGGLLDHLQISWMTPVDGGKKLVLSTYIEPQARLETALPESAALVILDVAERAYVKRMVPLPGAPMLTGVAEVAPGVLVGLAPEKGGKTTTAYRYDLTQEKLGLTVRYQGMIQGIPNTSGMPSRGHDFAKGSDGYLWTATYAPGGTALLRIHPRTLEVQPVGTVNGVFFRFLFHNGQLYLTGEERMRRVVDFPKLGAAE